MVALLLTLAGAASIAALFYVIEKQKGTGDSVDTSQPDSQNPANLSGEQSAEQSTQPSIDNVSVEALARGIARGEGYYVIGSLPNRSHNPGDLTKSFGFATIGVANKEGVLIFATDNDGWQALYGQLNLIFDGKSQVYSTDLTILAFAAKWTLGREPKSLTEQESVAGWAAAVLEEVNVANSSSLTAQNTLADIVA